MGVSARAGRVFQETDTKDAPQVTVINEALARRYFPNEDPLGKRVAFGPKGPWMTICGVVNDVKALDLAAAAQPEMYRDYRQYQFAQFATVVVARTASEDPASVAAVVQRQIRATNPDQPVTDVRSMRQIVADNVAQPRFYTVLLAVFAGLALVLAAAGLYGVLSCSVERRAHEIAIRMALGASQGSIFRQVIGHAALLLAAGVAAGLAGSLALTRLISAQLYQVSPTDPITFAAVSVLLAFVGLAASYLPARRAVTVDPLVTLRCE
jgi:putative ABC transport system permease protein